MPLARGVATGTPHADSLVSLSSTQDTLRHFVKKLLALGSVWFLAMPALVFSTSSLAPYNRHPVVRVCLLNCDVCPLLEPD
jgi:hypothetical protein